MNIAKILGTITGGALAIILLAPLLWIVVVFMYGVSAMVIGWAFPIVPDTLRDLFNVSLTNFQLGATLGFFGGAFRAANFGGSSE